MFDERRFRAQMVLADVTMKELASSLGINESTLYRKIKQEGAFTRDEINRMIDILKIKEPGEIFFANKLAETQERGEVEL